MRRLLAGLLLTLSCAMTFAEIPRVPDEIDSFARHVMRDRPTPEEAARRAEELEPVIAAQEGEAARELFTAMTTFLVGFAELGGGRTAQARELFRRSVAAAQRSIDLEPSSEGYRALADANNQLLDIGNVAYQMFNAWRPRDAAINAVELDDRNPLAHTSAASFFVSAPAIAGGNLDRAEFHLGQAAALGADSEYVRFLVAVWEGRLEARRGNAAAARDAFGRADAIYPGNWWLARIAGEDGITVRSR